MARGPVRINQYDQRAAPQSRPQPYVRALDPGPGLAGGLETVSRAFVHVADNELEVERLRLAREEDDARVMVSQAMAEFRAAASQAHRDTLDQAQDGWRGATESYAQRLGELRETYLARDLTPSGRSFLTAALDSTLPTFLDNMAEAQQGAREAWQSDTVRAAVDTASSVLAADPSQYEPTRAQMMEAMAGLSNANARRDATAYMEEQLAVAAVGGMVEHSPAAALRLLDDPDAEGPIARLSGPQRRAMRNQAQAEINRRNAEAREARNQYIASLRDTWSAQTQLLQRGIMPRQPLSVEEVALLGPDVAQNYVANLTGAAARTELAPMPMAQVAQIAAGAVTGEGGDLERLLTSEVRTAAARDLEQRREDPGQYALQHGLMRADDLMTTLGQAQASGDWQAAVSALRNRGADALSLRERGVTPSIAPLSRPEAQALSQWLARQPVQARLGFFSLAQTAMNRESYVAMMGQLSADGAGPLTAFAGYLNSNPSPHSHGPTVARRLLRGEEILRGGSADAEGRRRPLIDMPNVDWMRQTWRASVGDAYAAIPSTGEGPTAQENAFETFRAYYAALAEEAGLAVAQNGQGNADLARRAIGVATGGTTQWGPNNRQTLMPWGMTRREFEEGARQAFAQWEFLRGEDPRRFELRAAGQGLYTVYEGDDPLLNPSNGAVVQVRIRRPQ